MEIKNICVHHTGGVKNNYYAKSSHLTEREINIAHRDRWPDFPSELNGSFIGYNFVIYKDGLLQQYRLIGEETAAQKGYNFDTISICLTGNFTKTVELPTLEQKIRLKSLLGQFLNNNLSDIKIKDGVRLNLSIDRIFSHRALQPYHTECYGNALTDNWARGLLNSNFYLEEEEVKRNLWTRIFELQRLIALKIASMTGQKVGMLGNECLGGRG